MTDQLILAVVALVVLLVVAFEIEETWRWRGSENRPPSRFRIVRFVRRAAGGFLAIVTLRRSSGRHTAKSDPAPMASDDVARRLGVAEQDGPVHIAPQRIVVSGPRPIERLPAAVPVVVTPPIPTPNSRVRLLRDTVGASLVLIGFVVVAVNVVIPPLQSNTPPSPSGAVEAATAFAPYVVTPAPTETPTATADPTDYAAASTGPEPSPTQTVLVSSTPSPTPKPQRTPTPPPVVVVTPAPTQAPTSTPRPTKKPKPTPKPPPPPVVFFEVSVAGCVATFTNTTQGAVTYLWEFGDGTTDPARIPNPHTYANGDWLVTLTATNSAGKSDSQTLPANATC